MNKDDAILMIRNKLGASDFEKSLVRQFDKKGSLSEKQWYWVHKFAIEQAAAIAARGAAKEAEKLSLSNIHSIFDVALKNLKFPKIWMDYEDLGENGETIPKEFRLNIAGEKSRYTGQIMITNGGGYDDNIYYGRIELDGNLVKTRAMTDELRDNLIALNNNPKECAETYGGATGNCCFCRKELSDNRSIEAGYGKTCAGNYGLPWGGKKAPTKKTPKKAGGNDTGKGLWNGKQYDYCTLSFNEYGGINLYGWGTYGRSSVLAGQSKKQFLEMYDTKEEAEKLHPDLAFSSKWTEPQNSFNHLPDTQDDGYFDNEGGY